jgi:hypothetical protein
MLHWDRPNSQPAKLGNMFGTLSVPTTHALQPSLCRSVPTLTRSPCGPAPLVALLSVSARQFPCRTLNINQDPDPTAYLWPLLPATLEKPQHTQWDFVSSHPQAPPRTQTCSLPNAPLPMTQLQPQRDFDSSRPKHSNRTQLKKIRWDFVGSHLQALPRDRY